MQTPMTPMTVGTSDASPSLPQNKRNERWIQFVFWIASGILALLPTGVIVATAAMVNRMPYPIHAYMFGRLEIFIIATSMASSVIFYLITSKKSTNKKILLGLALGLIAVFSGYLYVDARREAVLSMEVIAWVNIALLVSVVTLGMVSFLSKEMK